MAFRPVKLKSTMVEIFDGFFDRVYKLHACLCDYLFVADRDGGVAWSGGGRSLWDSQTTTTSTSTDKYREWVRETLKRDGMPQRSMTKIRFSIIHSFVAPL